MALLLVLSGRSVTNGLKLCEGVVVKVVLLEYFFVEILTCLLEVVLGCSVVLVLIS